MSEEFQYPTAKARRKLRQEWDARRIKALREHMGMTQQQMADELEVRQQTISEWETGVHKPHRSTQKTLSLVAERAGFAYTVDKLAAENPTVEDEPQKD